MLAAARIVNSIISSMVFTSIPRTTSILLGTGVTIFSEKDIFEVRMDSAYIEIITEEINNPYFIINAAYEIAS